jgi:hypothetical protein
MIDEDIISQITLYVGNKEPCWISHISGDLILHKLLTDCCLSELIHILGEKNRMSEKFVSPPKVALFNYLDLSNPFHKKSQDSFILGSIKRRGLEL